MSDALRLALVAVGVLAGAAWLLNLRRVGASRDVFYAQREGPWIALGTRLPVAVALAAIAIHLLAPASAPWAVVPVPPPWRWLGAATATAGLALFVQVLVHLGRGFSMSLALRPGQELVSSGPYRRVRHPMYSALALVLGGYALATGSWLVVASGTTALAVTVLVRTPREEAMLEERFGRAWRDYVSRTGRYLPRRPRRFAYEEQDCRQTLREGLEEYYASDPTLLAPRNVSDEIARGLQAHDAAHVVFGCDTTVRGEVVLTRWSLLGAQDAIPIDLRGLRSRETRFLFADFFLKVRPVPLLLGVWDGLRALGRSLRMRARWPSLEWEQYADRSLAEIRREYGIRVV